MVSTASVHSVMPAFSPSQSPVESGTGIPPLSPPADQMELDLKCHSSSLQNGHALRDDSFARDASYLNNSSSHDVDEAHISQSNGTTGANELSASVETATGYLPIVANGEVLTSVLSKPAPSQQLSSDTDLAPIGPDYDIAPAITQAPTSSVREETPPSSIEPSMDVRKELDSPRNLTENSAPAQDIIEETADLTKDLMTPVDNSMEDSDKMNTLTSNTVQVAISTTETPHHPSIPTPDGALPQAPIALAPSPAAVDLQHRSGDYSMPDAPRSPGKVARERDDEEVEDGPATKRSRMDDDGSAVPEFKVPELPEATVSGDSPPSEQPATQPKAEDEQPITKAQHKYLVRTIQNLRKSEVAKNFKDPVDPVALKIPTYFEHIKSPMDLRTMEGKLKTDQYPSINAFVADFDLILHNCVVFNGPDHVVTKLGNDLRLAFEKQMGALPGPDVVDPPPADKKKKISLPAVKPPPSRRESRSSLPGSARSPAALESPQVFALGPEGVPLIRRDSTTVGDGRPKREIHRPPPRDLPYANQKPKKKKYQMELRFCQEVVNELNKPKYALLASPFKQPVDPVALNIPTYHSIIKKPMDLGTIAEKLRSGQYENAKEFDTDVHLVFQNCYKFNPPTDPVHGMGKELETIFNDEWKKMRRWIEDRAPESGQQTPSDSEDDDEEDDEEEEEEDDDKQRIANLQEQMAKIAKDLELIGKSKKASPPAIAKKASKGGKSTKTHPKKNTSVIPAKVDKKPAPKAPKRGKVEYVTYEQKQDISNRINSLPENRMATALKIIRDNMPTLKGIQDDELELDIDELSNEVLQKLYQFVLKYAPRPEDPPTHRSAAAASQSTAPSRPKKNKPMSKHEQEAQIARVRGKLSAFQHPGSDEAPDHNMNATADDTSGDDEDSEESEEE